MGSLSPSKAKAVASRAVAKSCANAASSSDTGEGLPPVFDYWRCSQIFLYSSGLRAIRISDLLDPLGRYAGLLRVHTELVDAKVVAPDILNTQGLQISPTTYDARFKDGTFVEVEVYLRL